MPATPATPVHDAAALQQRDDGNEQGARPRPRPCAEVDRRSAGAPCARARKGIRALERAPPRTPTRTREEGADRAIVCAHYASEGERRWERPQGGQEIGRVASGRLRLAAGLLLLALPLAVAVWTFGGLAAKRERNNADQELVRDLNSGASVYARHLRDARRTADRLARSRRVARAFAQSDEHDAPGNRASAPVDHARAAGRPGACMDGRSRRASTSSAGERTIGRVFVVPPFGRPLVRDYRRRSRSFRRPSWFPTRPSARSRGRCWASSTRAQRRERQPTFGCRRSNTERLPYPSESSETAPALITVRKRSEIAAAANDVRWRVIGPASASSARSS